MSARASRYSGAVTVRLSRVSEDAYRASVTALAQSDAHTIPTLWLEPYTLARLPHETPEAWDMLARIALIFTRQQAKDSEGRSIGERFHALCERDPKGSPILHRRKRVRPFT